MEVKENTFGKKAKKKSKEEARKLEQMEIQRREKNMKIHNEEAN